MLGEQRLVGEQILLLNKYHDLGNYLITGYHKASVAVAIGDFYVGAFIYENLHNVKMTVETSGSVRRIVERERVGFRAFYQLRYGINAPYSLPREPKWC